MAAPEVRSSGSESHGHGTNKSGTVLMAEGYSLQEGFKSLPRRPAWIPDVLSPDFAHTDPSTGKTHQTIAELPVVCNSFPVTLNGTFNCEVIKYDVIFNPPIMEDARQREELLEKFSESIRKGIGDHALDNARIYCWKPLDWDEETEWNPPEKLEMVYETSPLKKIILQAGQRKPLAEMDLQYQQQVTSVFLRELARQVGWVRMGRNHYDLERCSRRVQWDGKDQGELNMMDGFRMSLEYACTITGGELLNHICLTIDACSRVIDPNSVQDEINKIQAKARTPRHFQKDLEWELKGRAVVTKYNNKIFKIAHVIYDKNVYETEMTDPDDNRTTVGKYYKEQYNLDCNTYDGGVLLVHELPPRKRDEGRVRHLYLVPEFCQLTGYPPKIRKNHQLMKKLSRKNKLPSDVRANKCIEAIGKLQDAALSSNSPLQIDASIQIIQGRVLSAAPIFLSMPGKNKPKKISIKELQQSWKKEGMFDQVALGDGEWIMLGQPRSAPVRKLEKLYKNMKKQTERMGRGLLGTPIYLELDRADKGCQWIEKLSAALENNKNIKAVVAVIPCKSQPTKDEKQSADEKYNAIKRVCSKDHGIHSQCIQSCNLETNHVWTGITRQLFTKLGALPWKLQFQLHGKGKLDIWKIPTMLVGIDVNHDRKSAASPVAFVSTWDRDFVRTHSQLSYHTLANEVMNPTEMKEFLLNAMTNFKNKNRKYPKQVIIYRDGIASTQIDHVQKNEMTGINSALRELGCDKGRNKTKIQFILVNKRVNCRFVEAETLANVPRGLIVDNKIVSSQYWDFYITPADAPEGCTSTPTRFIIIRDELNLSQKQAVLEIESLTKQLCNLYYNWPGPVRVPAIVKNADKLTTQFGSAVNGEVPHARLSDSYHFL